MWIRLKSGAESFSLNINDFEAFYIGIGKDSIDRYIIAVSKSSTTRTIYSNYSLSHVQIVYDTIWKNIASGAMAFDLAHFLDTVDWSSYGVMAETDTQDMPF